MKHANDNKPIAFVSMFSGIEAASVAFGPLGWRGLAFAEIEKFPSAVLAYHYPDVPNVGDMAAHDWSQYRGKVDIVCGGPPCQAFSVAGLRNSLEDARGNLSLSYMRALHAISPRNAIVENVPGWLNTKDNAFGCFLGGLVGADDAVPPPHGSKWPDKGMVAGPRGRAAWRILDAQFFGLAQRRKRVIVVADFGNGADPAAVLFERVGMQGNSAPSREKREGVAPTISARTKGGGGLGTDFDLDGGLVQHASEVSPTLRAGGNKTGGDRPPGTDVDTADSLIVHAIQAGALRTNPNSGPDGVGVQADIAYTLEARAEVQAVSQQVYSIMPQNSGKDYKARPVEVAQPVMAAGQTHGNQGGDVVLQPIAFNTRQDPIHGEVAQPLGAKDNGNGVFLPAVTVALRGREGGATAEIGGEVATALRASSGGGDKPHVLAEVHTTLCARPGVPGSQDWQTHAAVYHTSAVRRLTPKECERLQGFPDGYTDIPWRGKPTSPDGPRYKALGNSWAVPKFRWLGERIQRLMPPLVANDNTPIKAAA